MARLGRPRPRWLVICPNGLPLDDYPPDNRRIATARARARSSGYCWSCHRKNQSHRVVEYRPVEEEEPRG